MMQSKDSDEGIFEIDWFILGTVACMDVITWAYDVWDITGMKFWHEYFVKVIVSMVLEICWEYVC